MWAHKPHTKTKKRTFIINSNSNSLHVNMNNINRYHLRINHNMNYHQPKNKYNRNEINTYGNKQIDNTSQWNKKKEGDIKEYISKRASLFVILYRIFEYLSAVQTILMILDLDNGLPTIHMKFGTLDLNGETFFTYVNSCAGMNVVNIQLHQCIITTNSDILESYIQFNEKNLLYQSILFLP